MQQRYNQNPLALLRIIRDCMCSEHKLFHQAEYLNNLSDIFLITYLFQIGNGFIILKNPYCFFDNFILFVGHGE